MPSDKARPLTAARTARLELSGIRRMMAAAARYSDVIRLEIGEPDFATPDYIVAAVKHDLDSGRYTHYSPVAGFPELRRALAARLQRDSGLTIDPDTELMVSVGGAGALYAAIMATVDAGDEVLIPDPGYPQYTQMVLLAEGAPVYYPLRAERRFQPDIAELRSQVTPRTKAILINSPHNPTGGVLVAAALAGIAALAQEHELVVIADEVYSDLIYDGLVHRSIASLPGMFARTITINSFSKTYAMTGWRLGYAAAPPVILAEMVKLQSFFNSCASSVSQRAGLAALSRADATAAMCAEYQRRRDWFVTALNDLPGVQCSLPAGAFYAFPSIAATGLSAAQFAERLLERAHVTCVPGPAFGRTGEGHVRMSFATSLALLQEAVARIGAALPDMRRP